jgi:stress response protein YsnF
MQTILATFDDTAAAQKAVEQLVAQGFPRASVHLQSGSRARSAATSDTTGDTGLVASATRFFSSLFDLEEKSHAGTYAEAVRRGSTIVAVDAGSDAEVDKAQTVLRKLGPINVDERAATWKSRGWEGFDPQAPAMTEDELALERDSVPVVQEELVVGKRTVDVGGLRVIKRISETPVSEMINLRQETATVRRKPVDRVATEADFQNFKEGTFEIRETAEEAVVGKTARVVEEVSIGRDVKTRSETVADTVRRTDVEVERIPASDAASSSAASKPVGGRLSDED